MPRLFLRFTLVALSVALVARLIAGHPFMGAGTAAGPWPSPAFEGLLLVLRVAVCGGSFLRLCASFEELTRLQYRLRGAMAGLLTLLYLAALEHLLIGLCRAAGLSVLGNPFLEQMRSTLPLHAVGVLLGALVAGAVVAPSQPIAQERPLPQGALWLSWHFLRSLFMWAIGLPFLAFVGFFLANLRDGLWLFFAVIESSAARLELGSWVLGALLLSAALFPSLLVQRWWSRLSPWALGTCSALVAWLLAAGIVLGIQRGLLLTGAGYVSRAWRETLILLFSLLPAAVTAGARVAQRRSKVRAAFKG